MVMISIRNHYKSNIFYFQVINLTYFVSRFLNWLRMHFLIKHFYDLLEA